MEHTQPTAGPENDEPIPIAPLSSPPPASRIEAPLGVNVDMPGLNSGGPPVAPAESGRQPRWGKVVKWLLGAQVILLLALAQVMWAGYRLGVGNQTIQIPFLKRSIDADLYKGDAMVEQTLPFYSSYFYKGVAKIVAWFAPMAQPDAQGRIPFDPVTSVYFWLH